MSRLKLSASTPHQAPFPPHDKSSCARRFSGRGGSLFWRLFPEPSCSWAGRELVELGKPVGGFRVWCVFAPTPDDGPRGDAVLNLRAGVASTSPIVFEQKVFSSLLSPRYCQPSTRLPNIVSFSAAISTCEKQARPAPRPLSPVV